MDTIRVLVVGAAGRMGCEVARAVCAQQDMDLVGAVDRNRVGEPVEDVAGARGASAVITGSLPEAIAQTTPHVMVDFTLPDAVMGNARTAIAAKVAVIVGTSGVTDPNLQELTRLCRDNQTPALVVPNFAIGAVLMMQFAAEAAKHFEHAEIVELHHSAKLDAPSGTALKTAHLMASVPGSKLAREKSPDARPSRGQAEGPIHIHSVRLPGLVAHQEVILAGLGQTLTIRHDATSRESFVPGVLLAVRKVRGLRGLLVGLEHVL